MIEGFQEPAVVIANLAEPKEKFWGVLLSSSRAGITIRGIGLESFDDWLRQVSRTAEEPTLGLVTMFVPLFRVERMFLDENVGAVPSYSELFERSVGQSPLDFLKTDKGEGPK